MFSHENVWSAIDTLAVQNGLTPSGLAKRAGLDPTTFNKSKRMSADGRPRWPSTESISKIIVAANSSVSDFARLMGAELPTREIEVRAASIAVPLLGLAEAGAGGYFDDAGFPAGHGWDEITLPDPTDEPMYALEVSGRSMEPLYREGDRIIVSPTASVRRGDRVVVRTKDGEVMAKVLHRRTAKTMELSSLNPDFPIRQFALEEIDWIARILWASQ